MTQQVKVPSITSISTYCHKCKGHYWNPSDNAKTQASAKAAFGIIPNACVNGDGGVVNCPYVLGLL